ncbi:MAG: aldehyde ferredoxin oxidoreductase C-terminal domain-containing protein [Ignisphaera sp.]
MSLWRYGTPNLVTVLNAIGRLPTKNHWTGYWEEADKISGEALLRYRAAKTSCFSCAIMCKQITKVENRKYTGTVTGGLEYETVFAFGSNVLISNVEAVIYFNKLRNQLGLDTISTGKVISFLFECYEKVFISRDIVDVEPTWGNEEAVAKIIEAIAFRKGIGDILAEGVAKACKTIGDGKCCDFALHVKGLEVSGQDPRAQKSVGLTWAISVRGADHLRSLTTVDELGYRDVTAERFGVDKVECVCDRLTEECKALIVKDQEDFFAVVDSVIMCKYGTMWPPMYYFDFVAKLLKPLTGIEEFGNVKYPRLVGERIANLKRCFNLREGIGVESEKLPKRFTEEPMPTGPAKGYVCNLEDMLIEYYALRGWDYRTGLPYVETLNHLDLGFVIPVLEDIYDFLPRRSKKMVKVRFHTILKEESSLNNLEVDVENLSDLLSKLPENVMQILKNIETTL